jgi:hypothetical protein
MSVPPLASIPLGVLVERRPATSPWAEHVWAAKELLLDTAQVPPWTVLRQDAARSVFFAGMGELRLFRTETTNLKHNMEAAQPCIWVVLRPVAAAPGMALQCITADPGEAHLYADSGNDLVEPLPMPGPVAEAIQAFIAAHHREEVHHKRRRDRQDPESLARRPWEVEDE